MIRHISRFSPASCLVAIGIILAKKMHDELPPRLHGGSSSVISIIARIIIPVGLIVTGNANDYEMSAATYILLGIAIVSVIAFGAIGSVKKRLN